MTTSDRSLKPAINSAALISWINRLLESLWLITVVLVPLGFFNREYVVSEAVIAYVEVPKIALLRTLVAAMAVLWLIEWGIQGRLSVGSLIHGRESQFFSTYWLRRIRSWLRERPSRWLFMAAWFFLGTTLLSTVLSGSFNVSMWGEVPGQDGYPAYTVAAYLLLFGVISTHLRTRAQFYRLIGALVVMGSLVGGYGIFQHYGHDFLDLSEVTGGGTTRVTAFMGNAIFNAAVMSMTIPLTLVAATITFREPAWDRDRRWIGLGPLVPSLAVAGLWAIILTVQLLGITFTFSRGPWLGMMVAVIGFLGLAALSAGWRAIGRAILILGLTGALTIALLHGLGSISILGLGPWLSGVVVVAGFVGVAAAFVGWRYLGWGILVLGITGTMIATLLLVPSWLESSAATATNQEGSVSTASASTGARVVDRFTSAKKDVLGGLFTGRGTHWRGSWRLIWDRPWFDFDDLSLSWLRPVIGYGPDLFRYTYLLESPPEGVDLLPLEPDHAHNFFIHQAVELGPLGLLSTLGLFGGVLLVGAKLVLRQRREPSTFHKLVLIGLVAILAGRFLEMMVGVARVSDLTILWVLMAMLVALAGNIRFQDTVPELNSSDANPPRRRNRRQAAIVESHPSGRRTLWRLAIVAWLIGGIAMLTWVKGINNVRAGVEVGSALESSQQADYQAALANLDRAIELAPDVSVYYNYRASVYRAYMVNTRVPPEKNCSAQNDLPYEICLAVKTLQSDRESVVRRPFYYRSRLALANSADILTLQDQTVRYYEETLALVPSSWRLGNELAEAYLEAGQPQAALRILDASLAITKNTTRSAKAYYLQGRAYGEQGNLIESIASLERSLELELSGEIELQARGKLGEAYLSLNRPEQAAELFFQLGVDYRNLRPGDLTFHPIMPESESPTGAKADEFPTQLVIRPTDDLVKSADFLERSLELGLSGDSELTAHQYLAEVYIGLGRPELSAESFFRLDKSYRDQGELKESAQSLEQSLKVYSSGPVARRAHQLLVEVYTGLDQGDAAEKHRRLSEG